MSEITNNPSVPTQKIANVKFPQFINQLGIIPTSYKDSMDYYQTLAWLCKFLEETVIPTVNQNGEAVEELQSLYVELKNYVEHYFDNLDVQEEINKKLDEMVESGQLQVLINNYFSEIETIVNDFTAEITTEMFDYKSEVNGIMSAQNHKINDILSGSPIPVASTDDMTDNSKIYLNVTDGYWYYYDSEDEQWTQGGLYQTPIDLDTLSMECNVVGFNKITGYYISSTGNPTLGTNRFISNKIPIKAGDTIQVKGESNNTSVSMVTFYSIYNDVLETNVNDGTTDTYYSYTAPTDSAYFRISSKNDLNTSIVAENYAIMNNKMLDLENEDTFINNTNNDIITSLTNGMTNNLFDSSKALDGYIINTSGIKQETTGNYFLSPFIPIIGNKTIYNTVNANGYNFHRIASYDSNYNMISDSYVTSQNYYEIPLTAKYIRFSGNLTYKNQFMVSYDSQKPFEKYGYIPKVNSTLYVSKSGNDSNTGALPTDSLLTISTAIAKNPAKIIVGAGTYDEKVTITHDVIIKGNGDVKITNNSSNIINGDNIKVELYNIKVYGAPTNANINFTDSIVKIVDCETYNGLSDGIRLNGCEAYLENVYSHNNGRDGINAHDTLTNISQGRFINCHCSYNSDDGLSYHENGNITVIGGEYDNNGSGGITPYGLCKAEIYNSYLHDNDEGIHAFQSDEIAVEYSQVISMNNLMVNNGYGILGNYYNVISSNDTFSGNTYETQVPNGTLNRY